ncbi:hypothetical protein DyAD56_13255 [Dyella sp. AD56]|nr:hypothetical protein DyAD56_13255 [Dyella sp. AD56]
MLNREVVRPHYRFSRTAQSDGAAVGKCPANGARQFQWNPIPTEKRQTKPRRRLALPEVGNQLGKHRRCGIPECNTFLLEHLHEHAWIGHFIAISDAHASTDRENAEDIVDREVKAQRGGEQQGVPRPDTKGGGHPLKQVHRGPMLHHDPFGQSGRTRGVYHVRQLGRHDTKRHCIRIMRWVDSECRFVVETQHLHRQGHRAENIRIIKQ